MSLFLIKGTGFRSSGSVCKTSVIPDAPDVPDIAITTPPMSPRRTPNVEVPLYSAAPRSNGMSTPEPESPLPCRSVYSPSSPETLHGSAWCGDPGYYTYAAQADKNMWTPSTASTFSSSSPSSLPHEILTTSPPSVSDITQALTSSKSPCYFHGGNTYFGFTLRVADTVGLGLDIVRLDVHQLLLVQAVLPGGAIEAWNKQCLDGPSAAKAVQGGDAIVSINGKTNCEEMLEQCRGNMLLKMVFVRFAESLMNDTMCPEMANQTANNNSTTDEPSCGEKVLTILDKLLGERLPSNAAFHSAATAFRSEGGCKSTYAR